MSDDDEANKSFEEREKARAEAERGEDVVFPESFRKLMRTLLAPWNRR
ncbi:hypothetical protein [Mycobacterium sp. M26]|nr:hypothetical protein [Mycobacterium sp. M26]